MLNLYKWTIFSFQLVGALSLTSGLQGCKIHLCAVNWTAGSWLSMPGSCTDPTDTAQSCQTARYKCNSTLVLKKGIQSIQNKNISLFSYDLIMHSRDCIYQEWIYHNLQRKLENGNAVYNARNLGDKCMDHPHMVLFAEYSKSTYQITRASENSTNTITSDETQTMSVPNTSKSVTVIAVLMSIAGIIIILLAILWLIWRKHIHRVAAEKRFTNETLEDESDGNLETQSNRVQTEPSTLEEDINQNNGSTEKKFTNETLEYESDGNLETQSNRVQTEPSTLEEDINQNNGSTEKRFTNETLEDESDENLETQSNRVQTEPSTLEEDINQNNRSNETNRKTGPLVEDVVPDKKYGTSESPGKYNCPDGWSSESSNSSHV